jgi:hypothetical protein
MGGAGDARIMQQQAQDQAAQNASIYNPDGSAKANDYHQPALPTSSFPELTGGNGHFEVHTDRLRQVAAQMSGELNRLYASVMDIYNNGYGGAELGGWSTADQFAANAGSAYDGISQFHADLNDAYQQVVGNLHKTAANYADAESASSSAARTVGSDTVLPGGLSSA